MRKLILRPENYLHLLSKFLRGTTFNIQLQRDFDMINVKSSVCMEEGVRGNKFWYYRTRL